MSSDSKSALLPSTVGWDDLPTEIYLYIFRKMDITSLRCCFSVSKKWRDIATYLCELQDLWQAVAKDGMVNNGVTQRLKSTLSWKDLYFNSLLWNYSSVVVCKINQVEKSDITNLHVYNDKLIVVNPIGVEYYDIETLQSIRLTSIEECVDVQESDDMLMVVTNNVEINFCKVTVFIKLDKDEEIDLENYLIPFTLPKTEAIHAFAEIRLWRLVGNHVYVIDSRSCLWECSTIDKSLCVKALARFYGNYFTSCTMNSIHVIDEDVYIAAEWGGLLKCAKDSRMFRTVKTPEIPTIIVGAVESPCLIPEESYINTKRHDVFDAFIKFPFSVKFICDDEAPLNMIHYRYIDPEMTSALQHGDVMFRGFKNGDITINLLRDGFNHCLNVLEFESDDVEHPTVRVVSLEVCELKGMHKLFVATSSKLYAVLLKYSDTGLET